VANATAFNFFPAVECPTFGFFNLYRVVVTDGRTGEAVTSQPVAIDVVFEPRPRVVSQPPLTKTVAAGGDAVYEWAAVTTDPRPLLVWRVFVNGERAGPLQTGATATFTLPAVTAADAGTRVTANVQGSCGGNKGARSELRWAVGPSVLTVVYLRRRRWGGGSETSWPLHYLAPSRAPIWKS